METEHAPTRLQVLRLICRPGWLIVAGLVGVVGSAPTWLGLFAPPSLVAALSVLVPKWDWFVWVIAALIVLFVGTVEGAYRILKRQYTAFDLARAKVIDENLVLKKHVESLSHQMQQRQRSQAICDALRERHTEGISTLLHRGVVTSDEYDEWMADERRFLNGVLSDMRRLGCSAGEIHSVEIIGVFPVGAFSFHAAANSAISMLVVRLDRIADVATAHDTTSV